MYECLDLERVLWGAPLAETLGAELSRRGARRPLFVASPSLRKVTPLIDGWVAEGRMVGVFDRITQHVFRGSALDLVETCRTLDADLLVTLGGGSPIDTAKVALLCLAAGVADEEGLETLRLQLGPDGARIKPSVPAPPFRQIVVPTTLAGAEFSDLAGCTDTATQVKQLFSARGIGSAAVLLAPELTLSTPMEIWLSTGIRALDHAIETLCSSAPNPYTDSLSLEAIRRLSAALRACRADPADLAARLEAQFGVWLACAGLNRVPWGASHGLGHQLGAVTGIPHGYCSCILLPRVLAFNAPVNAERQALAAAALGRPGVPADSAVLELVETLGLPTTLRAAGVERAALGIIAETSLQNPFVQQNPRPVRGSEDLLSILEAAY